MIVIHPDTNALHGDPLFRSAPAQALLKSLVVDEVELHLSPVVIAELQRQEEDQLDNTKSDLHTSVDRRFKTNQKDGAKLSADFDNLVDKLHAEFESELASLISRAAVSVDSYPTVSIKDLVERDLARRRPFQEKGDEKNHHSTGMRDTLIWEGLLVKAESMGPDDVLVFVTQDGGFLNEHKSSLHEDLLADLNERGISQEKVLYAPNLYQANTLVSAARKTISDMHAKVTGVATLALVGITGESVGVQLQYGGDYGVPDEFAGLELGSDLEDANIVAVDQDGEAELGRVDDETYVVRIPATVTVEGAMSTSEYFSYDDDHNPYELWEVLNDHYVAVSTSREVIFEATVKLMDGTLSAAGFELIPVP